MIRHLRPTDTAALLPFRHAAGPAQAFTVAGALQPSLRGFPATGYIALALSLRAWRQCWVDADDAGIHGVARVGARNSPQVWEVRDLVSVEAEGQRCASLLGEIVSAAASQQVMKVFLRVEEDSWVASAARRAGYEPGCSETLYLRAHGPRTGSGSGTTGSRGEVADHPPAVDGVRPRKGQDEAGLFRLYCAAAPVQVRAEGGMTANDWWASLERVWRRPHEAVQERDGQVTAWLRYGPVQGWLYFSILARPAAVDDLPGLVLLAAAQSDGRPMASLVASYDTAQAAVLERLGFTPERRFQVMTQSMVARVREPKGVVVAAS
jgi:hypothetical protein